MKFIMQSALLQEQKPLSYSYTAFLASSLHQRSALPACNLQMCIYACYDAHAVITFSCLQGNENLEEQISAMPVNYPYIAVVTMDAAINIFIVAEKVVLCKAASISVAIKLLLASFYVFNIEYPKLLGGVLYFFEYYLYNIRSRKNLPIAVIQLCNQLCD